MDGRSATAGEACGIVELRRYALHPGARETLIELVDRALVEPQEAVGMRVLGQFRDLDDPDSFVWLRGFEDMETRRRGLEAFYGGRVWKEHARAANATMVDSDDVLLLRPHNALVLEPGGRPPRGGADSLPGLLAVTTYPLTASSAPGFPDFFASEVEPELRAAGLPVLATFATEHTENTFPALPVREDAEVFVWMALCADAADHAHRRDVLERSEGWRDRVAPALTRRLDGPAEVLRLTPTGRSLLHG